MTLRMSAIPQQLGDNSRQKHAVEKDAYVRHRNNFLTIQICSQKENQKSPTGCAKIIPTAGLVSVLASTSNAE
ncbi:hypothetical protein CEXT_180811 [Caerostris extrusa]|uniref:Uncharacterized protein n=1 Tax=Caerostris extrusa TaxID=172846 RepID=A0AAV4MCY0_CAEEX|nr:hypothetical protein CEXT_180811 [Caerostris extrusa]